MSNGLTPWMDSILANPTPVGTHGYFFSVFPVDELEAVADAGWLLGADAFSGPHNPNVIYDLALAPGETHVLCVVQSPMPLEGWHTPRVLLILSPLADDWEERYSEVAESQYAAIVWHFAVKCWESRECPRLAFEALRELLLPIS